MEKITYLLFNGTSADGRGTPAFIRRTEDPLEALGHLGEIDNPYSTGQVKAYNHNEEQVYNSSADMGRMLRFIEHTRKYIEDNQ